MSSESTQIVVQRQKDKLQNQTSRSQISVSPLTESASWRVTSSHHVSFSHLQNGNNNTNRVSMTSEWIHEFSKQTGPAHGELFVPALIINASDSLPSRSGFRMMWLKHWITTPDFSSQFLPGGGGLTLDVSGSLWKNEQTGLNNLQFPFQLAYYMLSFGSEGLIFKNNPQIWGTHRSLSLRIQRMHFSFSLSSTGYKTTEALSQVTNYMVSDLLSNTLCGVLQPKLSEMFTLFPI